MQNIGKRLLNKFTPFMGWIGELKDKNVLKADIIAGITVALVLIPQSMAYAQLAGLPAYIGLYASFLPVAIASFFGSSRQLSTGPVAIVSLMTAVALEPFATKDPEGFFVYAALLALLVGIFQLSLGLLKLGIIVDFLSHPVVVGFTNAGALIIATSQLNKVFGVTSGVGVHQYEIVWGTIQNAISGTNLTTLALALGSIATLIIIKKINKKLPGVLIAVVVFTLISYFIGYENIAGGKSIIGKIPEGLPPFIFPTIDLDIIKTLLTTAIVISLVGFMEAISIAKGMASQAKQRISANQELIGQGLSNITSSLFSGYPVSGSFSRSAVNFSSGAKTGFSSIVTAIIVGLTLLFLTPLLYHLPQATLAAVIIMAVINLIKIEPIKHAFQIQKHDGIVGVITFFATLYFAPNLEEGIIVGVILSLGLFLYRSMKPNFVELSIGKKGSLVDAKLLNVKTSKDVGVYAFEGPLYFANAGYFEGKMLGFISGKPELKVIILDFDAVQEIDATGYEALENIIDKVERTGITILIARIRPSIYQKLKKCGFFEHYSKEKVFHIRHEAINYAIEKIDKNLDIEPLNKYMPLKIS